MIRWKFEPWIRKAVSKIVLPQDRILAGRELMDHMQDHYSELLDRMPPEDAANRTICAMGDADAVAAHLGMIHRPFWGTLLKHSNRILRVVFCLTMITCFGFLLARYFFLDGYEDPVYYRYDPYSISYASDAAGEMHRRFFSQPNTTACSDGYAFTVSQVAIWQEYKSGNAAQDKFYFQVDAFHPHPWVRHEDILRYFWAEDSLGNRYRSAYEKGEGPSIQGSIYHSRPLTRSYYMYLTEYLSSGAEWLDLHYDRSGRDIVLRIELEGAGA